MKGKPKRNGISVWFDDDDVKAIRAAAKRAGDMTATWLRKVAKDAAQRQNKPAPEQGGKS